MICIPLQEVTMKPPLPPEVRARPLSPPPGPVSPRARRQTRSCVGVAGGVARPRQVSPPAWFHPIKTPPPAAARDTPTSRASTVQEEEDRELVVTEHHQKI